MWKSSKGATTRAPVGANNSEHVYLEEFVFNISAQQKVSTDNNLW